MPSLGNYGTNLAGGFTVEGLQALARRCLELKWEQLLRLDLLLLYLLLPQTGSTLLFTASLGVVGKHAEF